MKLNDLSFMFKNVQKIKDEITKVQASLEEVIVKGSSGGGMIEVTANARMQILNVKIESQVLESNDKEMLEDLIVAAVNQAIESAHEKANEKMNEITGGLLKNLPEGFNIPGLV